MTRPDAQPPPKGKTTKLLCVNHSAKLSGGEIALIAMARGLSPAMQCTLVTGEEGPLLDAVSPLGWRTEVVAPPTALAEARRDFGSSVTGVFRLLLSTAPFVKKVNAWLKDNDPDVMYVNSLKAGVLWGPVARLRRIPVIWHVRDRLATDYMSRKTILLASVALRFSATTIVANSRATASTVHRRCHVVPSPVEEEFFAVGARRLARPAPEGRAVIVMVGRLTWWKGQHVLLRALARISDMEWRAVFVGSAMFGELQYEEELRALSAGLRLDSRVQWLGFRPDVPALLENADILVHGSVIPEPFGQTVVQGMAAAMPVVASGAGGPAELIESGVSGVLVAPGVPAELAGALRALLTDRNLCHRLARGAHQAAGECRASTIVPRLEALITATAGRTAPGQPAEADS